MFKKFVSGLAIFLLILVSNPIIVHGQGELSEISNEATIAQDPTENTETSDRTANREKRIKALKEKNQARISESEERQVVGKCKPAQKLVENLQTRMNTVVENRRDKYTEMSTRLTELSTKLQLAGVDTTELDAIIIEVNIKIATAITAIEEYNISLSDLASMDCEADPNGFRVVLDEVRAKRTEVISMQGTLRSGINEQVKPVLQTMRESLQVSSADERGEE